MGKYLLCRVASRPYKQVAIQIIIVSPCGNCLLCSVYNYPVTPSIFHPTLDDLDALFPLGTTIAIKEPWVKMSMGDGNKAEMLRVDSPTDIVFIDEPDLILKGVVWRLSDTPSRKNVAKQPEEWKALGNKVQNFCSYLMCKILMYISAVCQ